MFYHAKDVSIIELTMQNTSGYGIITFNTVGNVNVSKLKIENTSFENVPECKNYDYNNPTANFSCSGSGLFMIYHDHAENDAKLTIDQSNFTANRNFLPYKQFSIFNDAINAGFYRTSIPLQGAAGIAIFYLQTFFDVNASVINSFFHNNNGTLSASIAIVSISTTKGKTNLTNCLFDDNSRQNSKTSTNAVGGVSYYYLALKNMPGASNTSDIGCNIQMVQILTVKLCNFTKLGGTFGAAFHIKKVSASQSLRFRIEDCNFIANEANSGSAVYAVDHRFDDTLSNSLTIDLVNVNAENNCYTRYQIRI